MIELYFVAEDFHVDSLSQIALGAAVGEMVLGRQVGYRAALWGGICATLPDLDVFVDFGGAVENFTYHRGFSHSIFVLTLISPILAWLIRKVHWNAHTGINGWLLLVWLALITHPLLDCFTVYGTQILWPLNLFAPISWASIFIIDPGFTFPLLIGVICALSMKRNRLTGHTLNIAGLVIGLIYLTWTVQAKHQVTSRAATALAANDISSSALLTLPTPFNSLLWRIVAMVNDGYYEGFYSFFDDPKQPLEFRHYPSQSHLLDGLENHWPVDRLKWFTHGFYSVREHAGEIVMTDLRMGLEPTYSFAFKVAKSEPTGSQPLMNERLSMARDLGRLNWVWRRIWGPVKD